MKTTHRPIGRRALAGAAALAVGFVGLGSAAFAAEPNFGNIDENKTGSIIVHKHLAAGEINKGTADGSDTSVDGAPVAGVKFTAYTIANADGSEISLKQPDTAAANEAWEKIAGLAGNVPVNACADPASPSLPGFKLTKAQESPETGSDGKATIAPLPIAAYLVCETASPANIIEKAAPFVVTVPFPDTKAEVGGSTTGKWLYDVNVYPKNRKVEVKKDVNDPKALGLGATVDFPVTTSIPALATGSHYKYFRVADTLDPRLGDIAVSEVKVGSQVLAKDGDYMVEVNGQEVTAVFTREGLNKLEAAGATDVVVTFRGTVKSVGDGSIVNQAQTISDTEFSAVPPTTPPSTPPENPPSNPTNKVVTAWGDAKVLKYDANTQNVAPKTGLKGAKFQVYEASEPYAAKCGTTPTGDALSVNGQNTFTSDDSGVVTIEGLYVDKKTFPSDAPGPFVTDHQYRCYVLVETEAPAGYILDSAPRALTVNVGSTAGATFDLEVPNTKQNVPNLPLTGANGELLLTVGGASLLLLALGATLVARRRNEQN